MRGAPPLTGRRSEIVWLDDDAFGRELRAYVTAVAHALGVGPESTTVDTTTPASAYLALDGTTPAFPGHDLALLWDERDGWSAAVEPHDGDGLLVVDRLDPAHGARPTPEVLARFVTAVRAGRVGANDGMSHPAPDSRPVDGQEDSGQGAASAVTEWSRSGPPRQRA